MMGGGGVPMSHVDYKKWYIRNVALSNLRKRPCHPVHFKEGPCSPVELKKRLCPMSLRPKNGCVALSILGVYTH